MEWTTAAVTGAAVLVVSLGLLFGRLRRSAPRSCPPRSPPTKVTTERTGQRYLVIGGHGFLGSHIVEGLLARGEEEILIFDTVESDMFKDEPGVSFMRGDILNNGLLYNACADRDVVYHTAALLNYWSRLKHDFDHVNKVNFIGTKNVVEACRNTGVKKLLFPSSASIFVTADALKNPIRGLSEQDMAYPTESLCHYTNTKMQAEKYVRAANGKGGLLTGVLRPNAIYGPRDMFSNLIGAGYPGCGTPGNKQDYAYVENVVHAFFKLEEALVPGSPACGQAYFVSDDAPVAYGEFAGKFGKRFGHTFRIMPSLLATVMAYSVEFITRVTSGRVPLGQLTVLTPPTLIVSRAEYWFSVEKAKKELGWQPIYTPDEGIDISVRYYAAAKAASTHHATKQKADERLRKKRD